MVPATTGEELLDEIRALKEAVKRIEALLEERLIGVSDAEPDEVEAIREYEADKGEGRVEYVGLEDIINKVEKSTT